MSSDFSKTIVLVDDEKSYVDLLAAMLLEHLETPVHTFTRPLAALAELPKLNPGIIVTDYYMPQLNGFEFITQAAPLVPDVPFLLITGHAMTLPPEEIARIRPLKGVIAKPFGWRVLADEILRHWPGADASRHHKVEATMPTAMD
ncbi:MAG: response regulator [Verrucomicrobia bacterium]|nr:response regulator [Verrucomicrobiota bacterium]